MCGLRVQIENVPHLQRPAHVAARVQGSRKPSVTSCAKACAPACGLPFVTLGQFDLAQTLARLELVADRHVAQRLEHIVATSGAALWEIFARGFFTNLFAWVVFDVDMF